MLLKVWDTPREQYCRDFPHFPLHCCHCIVAQIWAFCFSSRLLLLLSFIGSTLAVLGQTVSKSPFKPFESMIVVIMNGGENTFVVGSESCVEYHRQQLWYNIRSSDTVDFEFWSGKLVIHVPLPASLFNLCARYLLMNPHSPCVYIY
jgi:hypothetical protein